MNSRTCPKCGAHWINGQLFWSTGKPGKEEDLAGLVCNNLKDEEDLCINEKKGDDTGTTWEYRRGFIDGALSETRRDTL